MPGCWGVSHATHEEVDPISLVTQDKEEGMVSLEDGAGLRYEHGGNRNTDGGDSSGFSSRLRDLSTKVEKENFSSYSDNQEQGWR